jgi:hypothetical protein
MELMKARVAEGSASAGSRTKARGCRSHDSEGEAGAAVETQGKRRRTGNNASFQRAGAVEAETALPRRWRVARDVGINAVKASRTIGPPTKSWPTQVYGIGARWPGGYDCRRDFEWVPTEHTAKVGLSRVECLGAAPGLWRTRRHRRASNV